MRAQSLLAVLVGAALAASCASSVRVTGSSSPKPPVIVRDSDHDRHRHHDDEDDDEIHAVYDVRPVHPAQLGIPPGHLPPVGKCRVWLPDRPPGHQPEPGPCARLANLAPPGSWLVYRPSEDRRHVEVSVYDTRRPQVVVYVRVYEADSGKFVREAQKSAAR